MIKIILTCLFLLTFSATIFAKRISLEDLKQLSGCFVVDYSYSENKSLVEEYKLDSRVYDVKNMVVKELIKVVHEDDESIRLQHFMQANNNKGDAVILMRHHAEIWRKNPHFRYKYIGRYDGNDRWDIESLIQNTNEDQWVREITNLDDGLRYHCLGKWSNDSYFSQFECKAFAPIPGRETRDMGRTDYNTMQRYTSVHLYGDSWLERQINTKTQFSQGNIIPLAKEVGKIWSVRLPESECAEINRWSEKRQAFWDVQASAWNDIYEEERPFYEKNKIGGKTRSQKISKLREEYYKTIGTNPREAIHVKNKIKNIIKEHKE